MNDITSAVAVNPALQECNPGTILAGALLGESLLLQPSPQLGQFYLVPFKSKAKRDRQGNVIEPASVKAQFVLGYKGYHLCEFMSAVTTPAEEFQQKIGDRGWVAVCDPTCGAGALLVAFANECRKKGINYQTDVLFVAQDIDYIVGMMCYLQMSLLGMPGYVVIGDTLASPSVSYDKRGLLPVNKGNVWYTPMLRIPVWQYRIFMAQMELVTQPIRKERVADAPKSEPQKSPEAPKKLEEPKNTGKPKAAMLVR